VKEWMDGAGDGALRMRNLCLIDACRETGVGEGAGGGGGKGPLGGGYRGPAGFRKNVGIELCESVVDDLPSLLLVLRCEWYVFSSGRGGKLDAGGGLGDDRDNLVLCCAIESRKVDLARRTVTGDGGRLDLGEGGGGGAKVGAGRGGGGGTDRL
jgi:hypothetical protein